ncbi:hypothetical protein TIFTF001_033469 [Ficus carica]|uniref:Uncharacterized protein n=1 Tax=Ficus carica TaxID=3494 RepID=A0AA88J769_FICCA|nr:hypothetical protein TIFTF001_033469 [Ficus carica]
MPTRSFNQATEIRCGRTFDLTREVGASQQRGYHFIVGTGQQQDASDRRIAELTVENEELQRRFNAFTIFNTPLTFTAAAFGSSRQPNSAVISFFQSGF